MLRFGAAVQPPVQNNYWFSHRTSVCMCFFVPVQLAVEDDTFQLVHTSHHTETHTES